MGKTNEYVKVTNEREKQKLNQSFSKYFFFFCCDVRVLMIGDEEIHILGQGKIQWYNKILPRRIISALAFLGIITLISI